MSSVTALGREIIETCEAFTSSTTEPARSAMKRCESGVIVLSSVPISAHERIVLQAAAWVGSAPAAAARGRCAAAITAAAFFATSPANTCRNMSCLR
jgi:hypothetical protein